MQHPNWVWCGGERLNLDHARRIGYDHDGHLCVEWANGQTRKLTPTQADQLRDHLASAEEARQSPPLSVLIVEQAPPNAALTEYGFTAAPDDH